VDLEDAAAALSPRYELLERLHRLRVPHGVGLDGHEDHLDVLLALRRDGEPAEVAHACVLDDLEAELLRVELERLVLVEDEDGCVADALNHRAFPPFVRTRTTRALVDASPKLLNRTSSARRSRTARTRAPGRAAPARGRASSSRTRWGR